MPKNGYRFFYEINVEDFEKPVKPDAKPTFIYKGLNTPKTWREVNWNPLYWVLNTPEILEEFRTRTFFILNPEHVEEVTKFL